MTVFVDTSALLAVLDADDEHHAEASRHWRRLIESDEPMVTTNYVLVETFAVVQRRLGMDAVRVLVRDVMPLLDVEWVSEEVHAAAVAAILAANRRGLSLVDCASFASMQRRSVTHAFAFDAHFVEQGLALPG